MPRWNSITDPLGYAKRLSEKERVAFIRKYGSETQKRGIDAVFGDNKHKPKRKEMWETRLKKGVLMVRTIITKRLE